MPLKLNVPYSEKNEVKELGGFWDKDVKTWYVPKHKKYNDFVKWFNSDKISIIAQTPYYICLNERGCWKCFKATQVIAFGSNNFYRIDEENDDLIDWYKADYFSFFSYPIYINEESIEIINSVFPFYKLGYSHTQKGKYWVNHCEFCNSIQGDWHNHGEPGGAFCPGTLDEYENLTFIKVNAKFDLTLMAGIGHSSNQKEIYYYSKKTDLDTYLNTR